MSSQAAGAPAPPNTWPSHGITSQQHLRDINCVPKAQDFLSGFKVCGVLCVGTSNQTHVSDNKENFIFYPQAGSTPPPSLPLCLLLPPASFFRAQGCPKCSRL